MMEYANENHINIQSKDEDWKRKYMYMQPTRDYTINYGDQWEKKFDDGTYKNNGYR